MMLEKMFELGYFNYQKFLLDYAAKLDLTPTEAFVFSKVLDQYLVDKKIKMSSLKAETNLSLEELQSVLSNLMSKQFYEIYIDFSKGLGDECTNVHSFFMKIDELFNPHNSEIAPIGQTDDIEEIISLLQRELKRLLSPSELENIKQISSEGNTYQDFNNAIESLNKKDKMVSLRNIILELDKAKEENVANVSENGEDLENDPIAILYKKLGKK